MMQLMLQLLQLPWLSTQQIEGAPQGVLDSSEMSDVAADVTSVAALSPADTTDVLSETKAADHNFSPAITRVPLAWPDSASHGSKRDTD